MAKSEPLAKFISHHHSMDLSSRLAWTLCGIVCVFTLVHLGLAVKDQLGNENILALVRDVTERSLPIVFAVVGALIISHQPRNRIGWLLMIPAISFVVSALVDANLGRFTIAPAPTAPILRLELTIADDGPGFPAGFHYGIGLSSMRERAEELGGQIHFENQPEGGARVQGWLPLPGGEE